MYIYIYTYIYVYVHISRDEYLYVYIYIYIYTYIYTHRCIDTHTYLTSGTWIAQASSVGPATGSDKSACLCPVDNSLITMACQLCADPICI